MDNCYLGRQIFHPSILLAFIRWHTPISPSRHLGSYSIRGVLGNCSGTFPSFSTDHFLIMVAFKDY